MTDTIGTTGSMRLSNRACGHSRCECHVACVDTAPLREHRGPLDQIRPDGGTCESRAAEVRRAVRSTDPGETPAGAAVRDRDRAAEAPRGTERPARDAENEERRQVGVAPDEPVRHEPVRQRTTRQKSTRYKPVPPEPVRHGTTDHEPLVPQGTIDHEPVPREATGHEDRLAAAERKAADLTALATHALSLQQKEWRRAEALTANNQRLQDDCHALQRELAIAREEVTTARIRTCRLDYQLSTLREQYVIELRRLHREAVEQARTLRAELTAAAKEADDLRATLSTLREQARITDGRTRITDEQVRGTDGQTRTTGGQTRVTGGQAQIADDQARAVSAYTPIAREQAPIPRGGPGRAASPAGGRHRRRAPSHRSNRRRLWSGPRSDRLSWMRSRSAGIHSPLLASIVAWLIRLR